MPCTNVPRLVVSGRGEVSRYYIGSSVPEARASSGFLPFYADRDLCSDDQGSIGGTTGHLSEAWSNLLRMDSCDESSKLPRFTLDCALMSGGFSAL